jgi:hypothetical protein
MQSAKLPVVVKLKQTKAAATITGSLCKADMT